MTTTDDLPDDETGGALRRYVKDGSDLSRPMVMDFFALVPSQTAGEGVASTARELGFDTNVEYDEESKTWTCYCTKVIVPRYETVCGIEREIDSIARRFGGRADGFDSFGNAPTKN